MHRDLRATLQQLREGAYAVDRRRRITYWNPAAERITGYAAHEVEGRACADNILIHVDQCGTNLCHSGCPLTAIFDGRPVADTEVFLHHRAGHRVPVSVRATPLTAADGRVEGALELFATADHAGLMQARLAELERLSLLDELTRLPNRRQIQIELALRVSQHNLGGTPFGVLLADIDHFKRINDTYGHDAGDRTLQTVAAALREATRSLDTVGRWGGEEFLGVFPNASRETLRDVAHRLALVIRTSIIDGPSGPIHATASFGGALARPGDTPASIVDRADRCLYESKRLGRDRTTLEPLKGLHYISSREVAVPALSDPIGTP